MALRSDVANLEHHAVAQLALNGQVVLAGVLRSKVGLEFAVKKDRTKQREIGGLALGGRNNAAEGIWSLEIILVHERSV